jgi:hypothetical protein
LWVSPDPSIEVPPPSPLPLLLKPLPSHRRYRRWCDFDPIEVARQLTILDRRRYLRLQPREFLNQVWTKERLAPQCPNLLEMIGAFNQVSSFITGEVLSADLDRPAMLAFCARLAHALATPPLNNFQATMAVLGALGSSGVSRLKTSWASVPKEVMELYERTTGLLALTSNMKALRDRCQELWSTGATCIPYVGMYLSDLTFIEEGNAASTGDGLINWERRRQQTTAIDELLRFQSRPFDHEEVSFIAEFVQFGCRLDENDAYALSLMVEGRAATPVVVGNPINNSSGSTASAVLHPSSLAQAPAVAAASTTKELVTALSYHAVDGVARGGETVPNSIFYDHTRRPGVLNDSPADAVAHPILAGTSKAPTCPEFGVNPRPGVATFPALLCLVSEVTAYASDIKKAFFAFYRGIVTPHALLAMFSMKFDCPPLKTGAPTPEKLSRYEKNVVEPARERIAALLQFWVALRYDADFARDPSLVRAVRSFVEQRFVDSHLQRYREAIETVLTARESQRVARETQAAAAAASSAGNGARAPPPAAPHLGFTPPMSAVAAARVIASASAACFRDVDMSDLLAAADSGIFASDARVARGPVTLRSAATFFHQLTSYCVQLVLRQTERDARAGALDWLCDVAFVLATNREPTLRIGQDESSSVLHVFTTTSALPNAGFVDFASAAAVVRALTGVTGAPTGPSALLSSWNAVTTGAVERVELAARLVSSTNTFTDYWTVVDHLASSNQPYVPLYPAEVTWFRAVARRRQQARWSSLSLRSDVQLGDPFLKNCEQYSLLDVGAWLDGASHALELLRLQSAVAPLGESARASVSGDVGATLLQEVKAIPLADAKLDATTHGRAEEVCSAEIAAVRSEPLQVEQRALLERELTTADGKVEAALRTAVQARLRDLSTDARKRIGRAAGPRGIRALDRSHREQVNALLAEREALLARLAAARAKDEAVTDWPSLLQRVGLPASGGTFQLLAANDTDGAVYGAPDASIDVPVWMGVGGCHVFVARRHGKCAHVGEAARLAALPRVQDVAGGARVVPVLLYVRPADAPDALAQAAAATNVKLMQVK